jgi:uncharacterized protein
MSETLTADEVIALFGLKPHPEGGHYRETFRDALGHADRAHSTAILFLLKDGEVARWHKVDAAEHWHFHGGVPLLLKIRRRRAARGSDVRLRSCRRMPGKARAVSVRGRWSAVRWRRASIFRVSRWRRRIGNVERRSLP